MRDEVDLYSSLPSEWADKYSNISFVPVLSEANGAWRGEHGNVHESVIRDFVDLSDYEVYACGPPIMVKAAAKNCLEKGLKKENFYSDSFEYAFESS